MKYISELNIVTIALRLLLALVFGGVIGIERRKKLHPAGFRTHMLVCVGACLAMLTNQYICTELQLASDVTRMGAQVISGIGFLGAGTIIVTRKQQVKGLTTAAGLWACACIGLALGIGFYAGALIAFLLILLSNTVLHRLETFLFYSSKLVCLQVEFVDNNALTGFVDYVKSKNIRINDIQTADTVGKASDFVMVVTLKLNNKLNHRELISSIKALDGVEAVKEVT